MQISARGDYAVRAAIELAAIFPCVVTCQDLAARQQLPHKFLESVMADLKRAEIVRSMRGADGGYSLARQPSIISIGQILRATDGPLAGVRGLRPENLHYAGNAVHLAHTWVAVRAAVRSVLDEVTLEHVQSGNFPCEIMSLLAQPGAWQPRPFGRESLSPHPR
ncbi:Rrf2 family transcriptional regulator [Rhizocola hellebori]|uniref:Rrf2 family transcriptional regulator n=1 Tax=Rhizocola hellebori TaxID=1392758 RepID=A0A8J3Q8H4_9ACTN|nr:Rrf2 family transcriptional regulator [Rhizocola hellebori]GIH05136.1 Rrf2 family transcriptional regulator [Rhizocola hellebori]